MKVRYRTGSANPNYISSGYFLSKLVSYFKFVIRERLPSGRTSVLQCPMRRALARISTSPTQ